MVPIDWYLRRVEPESAPTPWLRLLLQQSYSIVIHPPWAFQILTRSKLCVVSSSHRFDSAPQPTPSFFVVVTGLPLRLDSTSTSISWKELARHHKVPIMSRPASTSFTTVVAVVSFLAISLPAPATAQLWPWEPAPAPVPAPVPTPRPPTRQPTPKPPTLPTGGNSLNYIDKEPEWLLGKCEGDCDRDEVSMHLYA